jgi:ribokinase
MTARPRVAIVGHVEWATHALGVFPGPGEIRALGDAFDEPAGGGAVAAAQVANLGAQTLFFTALGSDAAADQTRDALARRGIEVRAARRPGPQTRAISVVDPIGERAIALIGGPLSPHATDDLGWADLAGMDAVYFTGRDPATLDACRAARALVVTARRWEVLAASGVQCDVIVASGGDPDERVPADTLAMRPRAWVITDGARGGTYLDDSGRPQAWDPVTPLGPVVDTYGCGDAFAAGLTVGLARGLTLADAIGLGARCGAQATTARGGLRGQHTERDTPVS